MRTARIILFLLALAACTVMAGPSGAVEIDPSSKSIHQDSFEDILEREGTVRVIAELRVDGLPALLSASRAYKSAHRGLAFPAEGIEADAALARGIDHAADLALKSMEGAAYRVVHTYRSVPAIALEVGRKGLEALRASPYVVGVAEDRPMPLPPMPEEDLDGVSGSTLSPSLSDSTDLIGADQAWSRGYTGDGWYVAVLDTGIRRTHQMFAGKDIVEACFSTAGDCPNNTTVKYGTGSAVHLSSSYAGWDHGTHVAGIATGNSASLKGVAKDAEIIAVQVFSYCYDYYSGQWYLGSYPSDQIAGMDYVYSLRTTKQIASVNMSLGGSAYSSESSCDSASSSTKTAIDNLRAVGIATAIASGNSYQCNGVSTPGCISTAVAVGATSKSDAEANFSNWQSDILDVFAPGVSILSSTADSDYSTEAWNGTSMATPHVAGAWAVLKQRSPDASVSEVLNALQSTGVTVSSRCGTGSKPRINVNSALDALSSQTDPPIADFTSDVRSGALPLTVSFTNLGSGQISSYRWSFGDGATSTLANPSHTYSTKGRYTVALTVTGSGGSDTETKERYVRAGYALNGLLIQATIGQLLEDDD